MLLGPPSALDVAEHERASGVPDLPERLFEPRSEIDPARTLHILFIDGVYSFPMDGKPLFHPTPAPTDHDLVNVAAAIFRRVERKLADREPCVRQRRFAEDAIGSRATNCWGRWHEHCLASPACDRKNARSDVRDGSVHWARGAIATALS